MSLLYIDKLPESVRPAFTKKLQGIATFLGVHPDWLMQVMWAESRLRATVANRQGADKHLVAAGLLQFTTASGIIKAGKVSSLNDILGMSALEQLDLVKWYFTPYRGKLKSYYDVYAVTFFPAMVGKSDDWVLQTKTLSAATIAKQNPAIAAGKKMITVADFKRYAVGLVPTVVRTRIFGVMTEAGDFIAEEASEVVTAVKDNPKASAGIGAGLLVSIWMLGWFFLGYF